MKLIDKVEHCLKNFPETANSDVQLTIRIIQQFHNSHLMIYQNKWWTTTEIQKEIKESEVGRIRRKFNEDGLYLPTDEKVLKQRKLLEKVWHNEMSPSNPSRG
jgi:hypothetical protein